MKFAKSTWISIAAAVALCALTLVWQRGSISAMNDSIDELKLTLEADATAGNPGGHTPSSVLPESVLKDTGDRSPGAVRPTLEEIVSQIPAGTSDPRAGFSMMPEMLEQFADFSVEELLAALGEIEGMAARFPEKSNALGLLHSMLTMVAAGAAPEQLLQMAEESNDQHLRALAFGGLLRKDLARARLLLAEADWPEPEKRMAKSGLMGELVKQDLPAALDFMRENEDDFHYFSGAVIGIATNDESVRQALWDLLPGEENSTVQSELTRGLVLSEFMREGLTGARDALGQATFLDDAIRLSILKEASGEGMRTDADATYDWIRETLPAESVGEALAHSVREWARKDFNAAGTWLGEQEPSPERDQAIGIYASTVARIDPEAAAIWAIAIEDQATQRSALDSILGRWSESDPAAMRTWAAENGVDTNNVIPAEIRRE